MREDGKDLARMLLHEKGAFYLCGPTWPVPDVYEALVGAMGEFEGIEAERAGAFLEELKEEERYVLEVCVVLPRSLHFVAFTDDFFDRCTKLSFWVLIRRRDY